MTRGTYALRAAMQGCGSRERGRERERGRIVAGAMGKRSLPVFVKTYALQLVEAVMCQSGEVRGERGAFGS